MSRYDPQRRRRLTTRANTTAVEALLDGEPTRPRRHSDVRDPPDPVPVAAGTDRSAELAGDGSGRAAGASTTPHAARGGCLTALLGLGGRRS